MLSPDVEIDLVVDEILDSDIQVEEPFSIRFTATVAAFVRPSKKRSLTLAAQHVIYSRSKASSREPAISTTGRHLPNAANIPRDGRSHSPTPSGASTPRILSMDLHTSIVASPKKHHARKPDLKSTAISLPCPYSEDYPGGVEHPPPIGAGRVEFLGTSLVKLPSFDLTTDSESMDGSKASPSDGKRIASQEFVLDFLAVKQGHANVGGVRLLLLMDEETDVDTDATTPMANEDLKQRQSIEAPWRAGREFRPARVLHEWPVIAEVWVASG
jgi:trafficking protein particle complex subunit 13